MKKTTNRVKLIAVTKSASRKGPMKASKTRVTDLGGKHVIKTGITPGGRGYRVHRREFPEGVETTTSLYSRNSNMSATWQKHKIAGEKPIKINFTGPWGSKEKFPAKGPTKPLRKNKNGN